MSDLDPAAIMAEHVKNSGGGCAVCYLGPWPCVPYRLADENVQLRAQVEAVRASLTAWDSELDAKGTHRTALSRRRIAGALAALASVEADR